MNALSKALGDAEPRMRRGAVNALGSIGARARLAAGELVKVLADKSAEVRAAAAKLRWAGWAVSMRTPAKALHSALRDPDTARPPGRQRYPFG